MIVTLKDCTQITKTGLCAEIPIFYFDDDCLIEDVVELNVTVAEEAVISYTWGDKIVTRDPESVKALSDLMDSW